MTEQSNDSKYFAYYIPENKPVLMNNILDKMRNNSGNYTATKILMMVVAFISLSFLIYWLFSSKTIIHHSLVQRKEQSS